MSAKRYSASLTIFDTDQEGTTIEHILEAHSLEDAYRIVRRKNSQFSINAHVELDILCMDNPKEFLAVTLQ